MELDDEDSGYRSTIPCPSSYCSPTKVTITVTITITIFFKVTMDAGVQWDERHLLTSSTSSLSPDFRLATPGLGVTPRWVTVTITVTVTVTTFTTFTTRLVDSGMLVQEEEEREEAIEEMQAALLGHLARCRLWW